MFYSLFYGKALQVLNCASDTLVQCATGFQCQCTDVKRLPLIKFLCRDTNVHFPNIAISMSGHKYTTFSLHLTCGVRLQMDVVLKLTFQYLSANVQEELEDTKRVIIIRKSK